MGDGFRTEATVCYLYVLVYGLKLYQPDPETFKRERQATIEERLESKESRAT